MQCEVAYVYAVILSHRATCTSLDKLLWKMLVSILPLCLLFVTFHQCSFEPHCQPLSEFQC